jgi:hypothetical protein
LRFLVPISNLDANIISIHPDASDAQMSASAAQTSSSKLSQSSPSVNSTSKKRNRRQSDTNLKSQRQLRFTENESLSLVSSVYGMIHTKYPSSVDRDVVLNRFQKEIVERFQLGANRPNRRVRTKKQTFRGPQANTLVGNDISGVDCSGNTQGAQPWNSRIPELAAIALSRISLGTNQCTCILERAMMQLKSESSSFSPHCSWRRPQLIILARDVRPPHLLAHIPVLAQQLSIPLLLLSGNTSKDMGSALGIKLCAIVMFLPRCEEDSIQQQQQLGGDHPLDIATITRYHNDIDSFIEYAKSKIPT